uniref:Uncharacterized protein n=1 Tax=Octopus bimaculoides TaxID=37653 RepID=A0A0L8FNW7_OCTBM
MSHLNINGWSVIFLQQKHHTLLVFFEIPRRFKFGYHIVIVLTMIVIIFVVIVI